MITAERKFVINASPERVWELIGEAMFSALKLERINIIDQDSFRARLRVRIGFVDLPLYVEGEFVEASPPRFLAAIVKTRGMKGVIWLNQKLNITLTSIDKSKTEVSAKVMLEEMQILLRLILLRMVKRVAGDMLDSVKECLEQSA